MNRIVVVFALVLLFNLIPYLVLAEPVVKESSQPSALEMTIRRYFEGQSGYQAGDLITRSQVEELQLYLRRTRQRGPASHPLILSRILPDSCRLAKLFYSKNGEKVLRAAAQELGGYGVLEALGRSTSRYTQLVRAVSSGSVDAVVELTRSTDLVKKPDSEHNGAKRRPRKKIIYTVDDFLIAVSVTPVAKTSADHPNQPTQ